MKRLLSLLVLPLFVMPSARATEQASGKTDAFSELREPFNKADAAKDKDRIEHLDEVKGLEWFQMAIGEKMDHIMASMFVLNRHGVSPRKTPNDYFNAVESKLRSNPGLYQTDLTQILSDFVYETEPSARKALDTLRT